MHVLSSAQVLANSITLTVGLLSKECLLNNRIMEKIKDITPWFAGLSRKPVT